MDAGTTCFELLARLSGNWRGRGRGQYPTIDSFEFEEETSIVVAPEYPMLRHEQRTWLLPEREASHWELGFWRAVSDEEVELSTAQDSGRIEVLRGRVEAEGGDGLRMELFSTFLGNDSRLVKTERILRVQSGMLHYTKLMATTTTPTPTRLQHLEARLERTR